MTELTQTKAPADDCMEMHMAEIKKAHPDWSQEQMVAVAMEKCGEMKKTVEEDGLFDGLRKKIIATMNALSYFVTRKSNPYTDFEVFKGSDGQYHWVARHTNNFEDREKEILSAKSHDGYVTRVDMGLVPKPELWSWHTDGSRQGEADVVWFDDHIVTAVGHFDETPEAETARKYYQRNAGKIELSHGFTYPKWAFKDGVYEVYNTFEISTLPIGAAANPYTTFEEITSMALSEEKRQWLESTIGKERTEKLLSDNEKVSKAVEELGAKYKDFAEVTPSAETTPEDKPKQDIANLAQMLIDILEGQAHVVEVVDGAGKAIKSLETALTSEKTERATEKSALDARIAALEGINQKMQAELKLTPRAASTATETKLSDADAAEIKKELAATDADPFWKA